METNKKILGKINTQRCSVPLITGIARISDRAIWTMFCLINIIQFITVIYIAIYMTYLHIFFIEKSPTQVILLYGYIY
jgi:hypothetical protein